MGRQSRCPYCFNTSPYDCNQQSPTRLQEQLLNTLNEPTAPLAWSYLKSLFITSDLSSKSTAFSNLMSFSFQGKTMAENKAMIKSCGRELSRPHDFTIQRKVSILEEWMSSSERGHKTVVAKKYGIHPKLLDSWKKTKRKMQQLIDEQSVFKNHLNWKANTISSTRKVVV
jgi:hypothetical protein